MSPMPPIRDTLTITLKIQPHLTGPKSLVHSVAAKGRDEEGLEGVDAALPRSESRSESWAAVWTETRGQSGNGNQLSHCKDPTF